MNTTDNDTSYIAESLPAFVDEAREHIGLIEQLLLQIEADPANRELLDALFRSAHTIKGSAGIFGLDRIVGFTHHIETLLDQLRAGARGFTPELGTLLLQCNDEIRLLVDSVQAPASEADTQSAQREALVEQLRAAYGGAARSQAATAEPGESAAAPAPVGGAGACPARWTVSVAFGREVFRNGMDPLAILNYLGTLGTLHGTECRVEQIPALDALDPEECHLALAFELETTATRAEIEAAFSFVREDCELRLVQQTAAAVPDPVAVPTRDPAGHDASPREAPVREPAPREAANKPTGSDENRYIRVQADRLDHVINLLGELVTASAGASLLARQARQSHLLEANEQIAALVEEIRNGTLQLRMVPIGETLARFRRVVRDTAAQLGKDIALEIIGGEAELDKSVVERIADPLMHLVRNALDHGLERPDDRIAAGKPPQGRLTLSARHESGSIVIRIEDDGRGIDRDKVLARAWKSGLVETGVRPPDDEILNLIFEPGFSTAEKVTNLSGRGVGMDVVRRNIEALRGSVTLSSEPGQGSRIEIQLPLTLAIIDGFLVGVGASRFILPLDAVIEVIEHSVPSAPADAAGRSIVELRGQVLPVVSLRALYGMESAAPERASIVVVQAGVQRYGVLVDTLLGQHQTVIKPLGRLFRSLRGMAGSSILGNGEVALIFDIHSLGELAIQPPPHGAAAGVALAASPLTPQWA
jgi:two-component system chemotaxis sensor kinase CheA